MNQSNDNSKQRVAKHMTGNENLQNAMFKEIDLIQDIIKRMASNSFLIKGWTITLVAVALLLNGDNTHASIAFIPLISFWFLDAFFLWQERMYRKLYKWVVSNRMKTEEFLFDLNAYRFEEEVDGKLKTMFSITLVWFYATILILIFIYQIILFYYM